MEVLKNQLTEKQFDEVKEYCIKLSQGAIEEILSGFVVPAPIRLTESDNLECEYCKYKGVCGVEKTKYASGRKCYAKIEVDKFSDEGGNR